jgi:hypothetical protein
VRPLNRFERLQVRWWDALQSLREWRCIHIHGGHDFVTFSYSHIAGFEDGCSRCGVSS